VRAWAIKVIVIRSLNKLYYDVKKNNKNNAVSVSGNPIGEGTPCTCLYGDVLDNCVS
jgi:hypothetical protein